MPGIAKPEVGEDGIVSSSVFCSSEGSVECDCCDKIIRVSGGGRLCHDLASRESNGLVKWCE